VLPPWGGEDQAERVGAGFLLGAGRAPWAVMLNRATAVTSGIGPVCMGDEALAATETLPDHLADRRVRYVPGAADWLAEREWRMCWGNTPLP
jgi:hypothetical protein